MTSTLDAEFMSIREVAERLDRHRVTVSRMVRDGELRAVRGPGRNSRVKIYTSSVREYLARNEVIPQADTADSEAS